MWWRATRWLVLLLVFGSATRTAAASCLYYDSPVVSLDGRVVLRTFYGPPNYGETPQTDRKERQALLVLERPICVRAGPGKSSIYVDADGQREVTLAPMHGERLSRLAGRRVRVTGVLFGAHTGHHRTAVLIEIESISRR